MKRFHPRAVLNRYHFAKQELQFMRYLAEKQGGIDYDVYCLGSELEFDRMQGIRTIAPTRAGLRLLVLGMDLRYRAALAAYVLTGAFADWLDS